MGRVKITQDNARLPALYAALALDVEADALTDEALTEQQRQAVMLLASGKRGVEVAAELGITQETVSRWRNSPTFAAAVNQLLRDATTATIADIRSAASDAVAVITDIMRNSEDDKMRLSAALSILRVHLQVDAGNVGELPTTPAAIARLELQQRRVNSLDDMLL